MGRRTPAPLTIARPLVPGEVCTHPDPRWFKRLTLRRGAALTAVWLMCVLMVPMFVVIGIVIGAIKGMGVGAHEGVMEAWRALRSAYNLAARE